MKKKEMRTPVRGIGSKVLKGIGIMTAVISLVLGVRKIMSIIQKKAEKSARVEKVTGMSHGVVADHLSSWYAFSHAFTPAELFDVVIDFFLAGLVIALVIRRKPSMTT